MVKHGPDSLIMRRRISGQPPQSTEKSVPSSRCLFVFLSLLTEARTPIQKRSRRSLSLILLFFSPSHAPRVLHLGRTHLEAAFWEMKTYAPRHVGLWGKYAPSQARTAQDTLSLAGLSRLMEIRRPYGSQSLDPPHLR